ncbi:MAG: hypothetical protein R3D25_08530 [Geminicoccaceae bacterium]
MRRPPGGRQIPVGFLGRHIEHDEIVAVLLLAADVLQKPVSSSVSPTFSLLEQVLADDVLPRGAARSR